MGTDGFEFVEFCHPKPEELDGLFKTMGFSAVAKHRAKQVTLYRQGDINFILNAEPNSFAAEVCRRSMARPRRRWRSASSMRATPMTVRCRLAPSRSQTSVGPGELNIPAIEGIGGLQIYLVDRYGAKGSIYDVDFEWLAEPNPKPDGAGLRSTSII